MWQFSNNAVPKFDKKILSGLFLTFCALFRSATIYAGEPIQIPSSTSAIPTIPLNKTRSEISKRVSISTSPSPDQNALPQMVANVRSGSLVPGPTLSAAAVTPTGSARITGFKPIFVGGKVQGMEIKVQMTGEVAGYNVYYTDRVNGSGLLAQAKVLASQTTWVDDGARTNPAPPQTAQRFYWVTPLSGIISDVSIPTRGVTLDAPYYLVTYQFQNGSSAPESKSFPVLLKPGLNNITILETAKDGTQYVENRQIRYEAPELALSDTDRSFWQKAVSDNAQFFIQGAAIHTATGFPVDFIGANSPGTATWTQPTAIGFYLQFLGDVITHKVTVANLTPAEALARAATTLNSLRQQQSQSYAYKGLIPWLELRGAVGPDRDDIAFIDNINLSQSVAAFAGAIGKTNLQATLGKDVYNLALAFLDAQRAGYQSFYDPSAGLLRFSYNWRTRQFNGGYQDIYSNEARSGVAFAVAYFGVPENAWNNLSLATSSYTTYNGAKVTTIPPFKGAFQIFWNTLSAPEQELIPKVQWNALAIFTDFMQRNGLPGFPSASSLPAPEFGYSGDIGINSLQYFPGSPIREDIGAPYALASAYVVSPSAVVAYLKWVQDHFPAMNGNLGFYDAGNAQLGVSKNFYAIDQGSFLVGLAGNGPSSMKWFLQHADTQDHFTAYKNLYGRLNARLTFSQFGPIPGPQEIPREGTIPNPSTGTAQLFSMIKTEGTIVEMPVPITTASPKTYRFVYGKLPQLWAGYYWYTNQNLDVRGKKMVLDLTIADSPSELKFEFKSSSNQTLFSKYVTIPTGAGHYRIEVPLANTTSLSSVGQLVFVVEEHRTKHFSGDFTINSIDFIP